MEKVDPSKLPPAATASVIIPFPAALVTRPPANASSLNLEQTGLALQTSLKVAQLIGMDTSDVATALTSAAMAAARGSTDEAHKILQEAYDRLEPAIGQRFEHLVVSLEEQEGRLREEGIAADVAREISRSRRAFDEGARLEAVDAMNRASHQMAELEGAWKQVKETLLRVDTLRDVGKKLGMDLSTADERLGQVRETLGESRLTAATLTEAGTQASAALVLLHEQVRNQIALLGQEAIRSLKAHPPPPGQREKAETRLKTILGHARAGRLKEASDEMVQFRTAFLGPPREGEPPREAAVPPSTEPVRAETGPAPVTAEAAKVAAEPVAAPKETAPAVLPEVTPKAVGPEPPPKSSGRDLEAEATAAEPVSWPKSTGEPSSPRPDPKSVQRMEETEPTVVRPAEPERPAAKVEAEPPSTKEEPAAKEKPSSSPTASPHARAMQQVIVVARELAVKVKERQKAKKDVKKAAALLKELTACVKEGDLHGAEQKLVEVRQETKDW